MTISEGDLCGNLVWRFHKVLGTLRIRRGGDLESTYWATSGQAVSKLLVTFLNVYEYYLEPYLEVHLNIVNELIF